MNLSQNVVNEIRARAYRQFDRLTGLLREATLDIYGTLGTTQLRNINWTDTDPDGTAIGLTPQVQPPLFIESMKRGEVIPVYLNEWQLRVYRDRSRILVFNNEFALCGVENRANYIVGDDGFKYTARPEKQYKHDKQAQLLAARTQEFIDAFCELNEMPEWEGETVRRNDEEGETFIRLFPDSDGMSYLRNVEPEHIRAPNMDQWGPENSFGIATDPSDVMSVKGYWVVEKPLQSWTPEKVEESEIVHFKMNVKRNAKRGLPTFYPVETNLRRCEDLLASMSHMAKSRAKIALIRTLTGATNDVAANFLRQLTDIQVTDPATGQELNLEQLRFGTVLTTGGTAKYEFPPGNIGGNEYVEVLQAELRAIAARLQMPEWMFTALADAKYSNAFVVEAPVLKAFSRIQKRLCRKFGSAKYGTHKSIVWRAIDNAIAAGMLPAEVRKFVVIDCKGPSLEARDKSGEATTNKTYVEMGVKTVPTVQSELGLDPEQEQENQKKADDAGRRKTLIEQIQTITSIQTNFYSGQLPREAAGALLALLGCSKIECEQLLPLVQGVNRQAQPAPQPGMPGQPDNPAAANDAALGNEPQEASLTTAQDTANGEELVKQAMSMREQGFSGTITDTLGREYTYVNGVRIKKHNNAPHDNHTRKAVEHQKKLAEIAHLFTNAPEKITGAHLQELGKHLAGGLGTTFHDALKTIGHAIKEHVPAHPLADSALDTRQVGAGEFDVDTSADTTHGKEVRKTPEEHTKQLGEEMATYLQAWKDDSDNFSDNDLFQATKLILDNEVKGDKTKLGALVKAIGSKMPLPQPVMEAVAHHFKEQEAGGTKDDQPEPQLPDSVNTLNDMLTGWKKQKKAHGWQAEKIDEWLGKLPGDEMMALEKALGMGALSKANVKDNLNKLKDTVGHLVRTGGKTYPNLPGVEDLHKLMEDMKGKKKNHTEIANKAAELVAKLPPEQKAALEEHYGKLDVENIKPHVNSLFKKLSKGKEAHSIAEPQVKPPQESQAAKESAKVSTAKNVTDEHIANMQQTLQEAYGKVAPDFLAPLGEKDKDAIFKHVDDTFEKEGVTEYGHKLQLVNAALHKKGLPIVPASDNGNPLHEAISAYAESMHGMKKPAEALHLGKTHDQHMTEAVAKTKELLGQLGNPSQLKYDQASNFHKWLAAKMGYTHGSQQHIDAFKELADKLGFGHHIESKHSAIEAWNIIAKKHAEKTLAQSPGGATTEEIKKHIDELPHTITMKEAEDSLKKFKGKIKTDGDMATLMVGIQNKFANGSGAFLASLPKIMENAGITHMKDYLTGAGSHSPAAEEAKALADKVKTDNTLTNPKVHKALEDAPQEKTASVDNTPVDNTPVLQTTFNLDKAQSTTYAGKKPSEVDPTWKDAEAVDKTKQSYGGIVMRKNDKGEIEILLRKPTNAYGGYSWTFPKGKIKDKGGKEHPDAQTAALAEVAEETGHKGQVIGHLPGTFVSTPGYTNNFFLMKSAGEDKALMDKETEGTQWVTLDKAHELIGTTTNSQGRERDLKILEAIKEHTTKPDYSHFPESAEGHFTKPLGGSTGAVELTHNGKQFVRKKGASPAHIKEEALADSLYDIMGAPVAKHKVYNGTSGPVKIAEKVKGKILSDYLATSTYGDKMKVYKQLQKHFVADALLGNWDVIGQNKDNVIVGEDGRVYRIDNGGALRFRAQGGDKGQAFGSKVVELKTLLDPNVNPQTAEIFKGISQDDINKQIANIKSKKDKILAAIPDAALRDKMAARIDSLDAGKVTIKKFGTQYSSGAEGVHAVIESSLPKAYFNISMHASKDAPPEALKYLENLTTQEAQAIKEYTNGSYSEMNRALYKSKGQKVGTYYEHTDKALQEAFKKQPPLPKPITLYRGASPSNMPKTIEYLTRAMKSGKTIAWAAYQSCGSVKEKAWSGNLNMEIRNVKHGAIDVAPISNYSHESEILLNRGTKYKVVSVTGDTYKTHVVLEQVHDE